MSESAAALARTIAAVAGPTHARVRTSCGR
jgi:hypothetical protein